MPMTRAILFVQIWDLQDPQAQPTALRLDRCSGKDFRCCCHVSVPSTFRHVRQFKEDGVPILKY